jgi:hypothetical protein
MPHDTKLCARCHSVPRTSSSYCPDCKRLIDREANARRIERATRRKECVGCGDPRDGKHHTYCVTCLKIKRAEWMERNKAEVRLCARCQETPRETHMSYCRPCHRELGRQSRERTGGKKPQETCSRCGRKRDGRHPTYCAQCNREYRKERLLAGCIRCGEPRQPGDKVSTAYCYLCWRDWWLMRKYKITPEQYDQMLADQGNRCAICRCEENGRTWHIDHCHETGNVRGVLCDNCNRGLGHFKDSQDLLHRAVEYLKASH